MNPGPVSVLFGCSTANCITIGTDTVYHPLAPDYPYSIRSSGIIFVRRSMLTFWFLGLVPDLVARPFQIRCEIPYLPHDFLTVQHGHYRVSVVMSSGMPSAKSHQNITIKLFFVLFPMFFSEFRWGSWGHPPVPSSSNSHFVPVMPYYAVLLGVFALDRLTKPTVVHSESGNNKLPAPGSAGRRPRATRGPRARPPPAKLKFTPLLEPSRKRLRMSSCRIFD